MPDSRIDVEVLFRPQGLSNVQREFQSALNASTGEANRLNQATSSVRLGGLNDAQTLRYAIASITEETSRLAQSQAEVQRRFGEWAGGRSIANTRTRLFDLESDLREQLSNSERMIARAQISAHTVPQTRTQQRIIEEQHQGFSRPALSAEESARVFEMAFARQEQAQAAAQARQTAKAEQEANLRIQIAEREARESERAAQRGYTAADREIRRENALRQREQESIGNAAIKAAAEREKAGQVYVERASQILRENERAARGAVTTAFPGDRNFGFVSARDLENAQYNIQRMQTQRRANEGLPTWMQNLNRQGGLEAQASIVNTVQALASGMDPLHVLIMESSQIAGAAVQGGLISFKNIISFIGSTAGMAATALAAVAAGLGTVIYRGAEARSSMATTQGNLAERGFGGEGVINQQSLISERRNLQRQFRFLGSSDVSTIVSQFDRAAPEAQQFRTRLQELSVSVAAQRNIGVEDAAKELGKAAEAGASGLIKFTEELNIGDAITRERLQGLATVNPTAAFRQALELIEQREVPGRQAAASDPNAWFPGIPKLLESIRADVDQGTIFNTARYIWSGIAPVNPSVATQQTPVAMQTGLNLAVRLTPEDKERVELQERYNKLLETQRELLQSIANLPAGGPEIDIQMERLARVNEAIRNVVAVDKPKGAKEQRDNAAEMASLQARLAAAERATQHDITQANRVREARAAIEAETTRQHEAAVNIRGQANRRESAEEIQAKEQSAARAIQLEREHINIQLQRAQLERAQIGPANLPAQREVLRRNLEAVRSNPASEESTTIGLETEDVNLSRQIRMEVENTTIAQLRQGEIILQEREDLAGIVRLRREEAAIIEGSQDRTPAERVAARTQLLQSQIQAESRSRQLQIQAIEQVNQAEQRRVQTLSSYQNLRVASGDTSTWQAAQAEQQLTTQVTDAQARRLTAIRDSGRLSLSERIRVNNELAQLYESDAQKQIDLQTRITQSIREENNRRTENFKNFFSSIESASADLLTAGLLKTQTKQEALRSFASSIVTSFVKETESMASKFAGKGLAKLLDVKLGEGEDSSISNVLAKKAGSLLGITVEEPKLNQAAVAQRMQQAGDTQKQAADLMLQAAQQMKEEAGQGPYKGGTRPELSTQVTTETQARAGMRYRDSETGTAIAGTLRDRGWSDAAIQGALNNAMTESSLNPNAVGAAKERGLYQFHPASHIKPFEAAYKGDWSTVAQTNYMADVVERSMPGYSKSTDPRRATEDFLKGFEKPKDQSERQVSARFANNAASREILYSAETVKVEPSSIAQGFKQGQQQLAVDLQSAVQEGTIQGQTATISATQQDISQTLRNSETLTSNSSQLTENNASIRDLTQAFKEQKNQISNGAATAPVKTSTDSALNGVTSAASGAQQGLQLFSSAAGIASSAALLFGKNLSPTGKAIVGGVSLASNLLSFGTKAASLFAAPATGGLSLAGLFAEQGAIIPSAAGGMQIKESSLPVGVKHDLREMARSGNVGMFSMARMVPGRTGMNAFDDGKGGRWIVAHDGEMVVPATETRMILGALNSSPISAEGGLALDAPLGGSINPRGIRIPAMVSAGIRDTIADNSTSIVGPRTSVNNTTTLHYSANTTGYHPYKSRAEMEGLLRQHGGTVLNYLERAIRNGSSSLRVPS